MHCVSEAEFRIFKERASVIVANHLGELDTLSQESIRLINLIPQVASVYCCSGHTKQNGMAEKDSSGYIILAVTDINPVYSIYRNILLIAEGNTSDNLLRTTSHMYRLSLARRVRLENDSSFSWYNALIIGFPDRRASMRLLVSYNRTVENAIKMTLDELGIKY